MLDYNDNLKCHDCLNCSHSYVTDEDDDLHCPFSGVVNDDGWCEKWN